MLFALSFWSILLLATQTLAQTTTSCNPTEKSCPADTALSSTYTHDFTTGADDDNWNVTAGSVKYTSSGAEFTITKSGDHPTIQSKWYIFFGRVSFFLKSSAGTGIVSSAILESDDLDEVDWEWLGGEPTTVQTNFFGKGNTTTADREVDATLSSSAQTTSHNYTISWTKDAIKYIIDNTVVRTVNYADAVALNGKNFPQTPMNVRIGIWAGGDSGNEEGTIEWAGGKTDYTKGPFTMVLESVEVVNENPAATYSYGDLTGDYDSIKIDKDASASSSSSAGASSSVSAGATKTAGSAAKVTAGASASGSSEAASASQSAAAVKAQAENAGTMLGWKGWWSVWGVGVAVALLL